MSSVSEVDPYPDFEYYTNSDGSKTPDRDIALLKLSAPITAPAMLLADSSDASLYAAGTSVAAAGWGDTVGGDDSSNPENSQYAYTVEQTQSDCEQHAGDLGASYDTVAQICAIDAPTYSEGTCHGDSGGPLVAANSADQLVEIGVTSWGSPDCSTDDADFFANVSEFSSWLGDQITQLSPPVSETGPATAIAATTATLTGTVNPSDNDTSYWFQYGPTSDYGNQTTSGATNSGDTDLGVSAALTGLPAGQTVHYRLVANNQNGTTYGTDQTFETLAPPAPPPTTTNATAKTAPATITPQLTPPIVAENLPGSVGQFSAELIGAINPNGLRTSFYFQYGHTTAYGNRTSVRAAGDGVNSLLVSLTATGLEAGTKYHYQLVAVNAEGTTYGADETFRTHPAPLYGTYTGETSQRWPVIVNLNDQLQITGVRFGFTLYCQRGRASYDIRDSPRGWRLNADAGDGFEHTFTDDTGTRYRVSGQFTTTGRASGTFRASWYSHRLGSCSTGLVHWSAD